MQKIIIAILLLGTAFTQDAAVDPVLYPIDPVLPQPCSIHSPPALPVQDAPPVPTNAIGYYGLQGSQQQGDSRKCQAY